MSLPKRWESTALKFSHEPVLLKETIEGLNIDPCGIYVDGTLGGGGHSYEIANRLTEGMLIGIDQDIQAINAAKDRLAPFADHIRFVNDNYVNMPTILDSLGIDKVNGILLDVGVSSYQIDDPERGFSYTKDAPLDMRMNRGNDLTAYDVVNTYSQDELARILRIYGEEDFANNIAKNIIKNRNTQPIETTGQLAEIVEMSIPEKVKRGRGGMAKKTFQALRIEVNSELDVLEDAACSLIDRLAPGGRFAIITFHSLEDRIVKNAFKAAEHPCTCPPEFPVCICGAVPKGHQITKKPILPSIEECERNKRSKSAKLRIFEKN